MRVLDLFSGIGGFSLGLERAGMRTAAFCEVDPFCRRVLKRHWPEVPIYDDVRKIRDEFDEPVDLICGGFPCQPFSVAGKRQGKDDDRHLWPAMFACIQHYRPAWVIGENVSGLVNMGLDDVLSDLEGEGYSCQTFIIPACAVGAPHRRDRLWIVAYATSPERRGHTGGTCRQQKRQIPATGGDGLRPAHRAEGPVLPGTGLEIMANANDAGCGEQRRTFSAQPQQPSPECCGRRQAEPGLGRSSDGVSGWLDGAWEAGIPRITDGGKNRTARLHALGNAVVPQIPEIIGRAIMSASQ